MKKRWYILIAAVLVFICTAYNIAVDSRYVIEVAIPPDISSTNGLQITTELDGGMIKISDQQIKDHTAYITVESVSAGKVWLMATLEEMPDEILYFAPIYIHSFGIITVNDFFGKCTGGWMIEIAVLIFLASLIVGLFIHIRKEMRRDLYQYSSVRNVGFLLLLTVIFVHQIFINGDNNDTILDSSRLILNSAGFFSIMVLPGAFITFIMVTISNIILMHNEGRNWRNMLGCILGILVCIGTIFPSALNDFLQNTPSDVHDEQKMALYVEMFVENTILAITAYLECILMGTIILSTIAARKIPAFDKDDILILGCQIKKDGTLTNLLKNRADRAVEFAKMQKKASGKDIVFIPSGGKGDDEVIAEAEAIRNYLVETGIPEERILVENKSANTFENLKNSMELIRSDGKTDNPKIAFSTTNYHVFRSGFFASQQGIKAEGIGAKTKRYFWINAFIREFIAALAAEWKTHIKIVAAWILVIICMISIVYLSINVL